ncbi:TIGR04063 family PEP-CTERM/XrtA system glycosyltransferase [Chitinivorax sp. PXF-14]|uniref:TIGR04063 family PEP-CTERM/XrtA system glycosyltransferase n=1 Tax=Chitinivorax sp. PXF-14 TaxID=3230488 RepID=UPI0034658543
MRILHVLDHSIPLHSGYTFRTAAILREQRKLGWETFHLTSPKQENCTVAEEDIDGLHFFRTPPAQGWMAGKPVLGEIALIDATARRLEEVARRIKPDVLHAHSPVLNAIPALRVGRKLGIPVVYEVRAFWEDAAVDHGTSKEWGLRYRATRGLETYALKHVDAVTTICEGLRGDIVARGVPADKITVIPNAVDIEKFTVGAEPDRALQASLGLEGKTVLGFIGSFYGYEGLNILLDALPMMLREKPDIRLLLTGGGHQEAALREQAAALGIADKVVFTGRVPNAEVPRYYDLVDVLVYPRLPMRLTELVTPLKPLEAMAQGRLVAASDVGGHRELIQPDVTGVLFKAADAADLARQVLALVNQPQCWPQMKADARRFVETERNWAKSVGRYQGIYPRLINGAAR